MQEQKRNTNTTNHKLIYEKLLDRITECSHLKVPMSRELRTKYKDLYAQNPQLFKTNVTKSHYMEMKTWVFQGKVWRVAIMGFTRNGKSEVGQTWTMLYIDVFNEALANGVYEAYKKQGIEYKTEKLQKLKIDQILFSQSNYLYELREKQKTNNLILGYPRIIDEDEKSIGGLGSMSEHLEIENLNNITAQAIQSEYQIRPDKFIMKNTVYGLFQEMMDRNNRVNWSMLYEIRVDPSSAEMFRFIGWVATPLHEDEELRIQYNKKKKDNIIKVIEGTHDQRLLERMKVSRLLAKDPHFITRSANGVKFILSKYQQECILNEWIVEKKIQNFNTMEKQEIVDYARMLAEKEYLNI